MSKVMNTKVFQLNMSMLKKEEEHKHRIHSPSTQTLETFLRSADLEGELFLQDNSIQNHFLH